VAFGGGQCNVPGQMFGSMNRRLQALVLLAAVAGCHRGARSAEDAYAAFETAVKAGDAAAFYAALDTPTRWSIESAFSDHRMMRTIIGAKYPEAEAQKELARLAAAEEADVARYFAHVDRERQILARYKARVEASGDVKVQAIGDGEAAVGRGPGPGLRFHRDDHGRWGFSELAAEWALEKDRAAHAVKTVRENAALYQKADER
jgi:hypothetical protein